MAASAAREKQVLLPEEYTVVQTGKSSKAQSATSQDDEDLVDTTAPLTLISRKTKRLEKQRLKRKSTERKSSLLNLPLEVILDILSWLRPSEVLSLVLLNHAVHGLILENENFIARIIIQRRYHILSKCFPLPIAASRLDAETQAVLLGPRRRNALGIHKIVYQHISPINLAVSCSCTWCIFCWNNLNLILDLHHFQHNFDERIPIPNIPRGTTPQWNRDLLLRNSQLVERAMESRLAYALILEKHLATIVSTITRKHQLPKQVQSASGKWVPSKQTIIVPVYPERPYELTDREALQGTDDFLARPGKPSYELFYHRDSYYSFYVYVPNRKWSKEKERWMYYDNQHDKDVALALRWFGKPLTS